jgi:hypothetical protein
LKPLNDELIVKAMQGFGFENVELNQLALPHYNPNCKINGLIGSILNLIYLSIAIQKL